MRAIYREAERGRERGYSAERAAVCHSEPPAVRSREGEACVESLDRARTSEPSAPQLFRAVGDLTEVLVDFARRRRECSATMPIGFRMPAEFGCHTRSGFDGSQPMDEAPHALREGPNEAVRCAAISEQGGLPEYISVRVSRDRDFAGGGRVEPGWSADRARARRRCS